MNLPSAWFYLLDFLLKGIVCKFCRIWPYALLLYKPSNRKMDRSILKNKRKKSKYANVLLGRCLKMSTYHKSFFSGQSAQFWPRLRPWILEGWQDQASGSPLSWGPSQGDGHAGGAPGRSLLPTEHTWLK